MSKRKIPEVRFEGFEDKWEDRRVGEIANIVRGASPRPIEDRRWFDDKSEVGWLRISDVTTQDGRIHYLEQRLSIAGQEKTRVLRTPHLLLSIAATVGKPVINYVETGVHDGFLIFLEPKFEQEFMFQWLERFRDDWGKYGQPGSQVNLNSGLVKNQVVSLPTIQEQDKVGNFFNEIDKNIVNNQIELNKLKNFKQAMLQKMFPKEGEKEPEVRFEGFSEEWDKYRLDDLGSATSGTSIESEFNKTGKYKVINIGSYSEESVYNDQGIRANYSPKVSDRILNKNDLVMILNDKTTVGNIIGRALLIDEDNSYIYNQRTQRIEINQSIFSSQFLYTMLNSPRSRAKIIKGAQGNTQIYVNWSVILNYEYLIPTLNEQTKIGNFFKNLDKKIELEEQKLEKLKQFKKAMLQKMFV